MKIKPILLLLTLFTFLIAGCGSKEETTLKIDYEKYVLDNGLEVILHQDNSDPITAVAIQYHVGSNREETGKTGFAHLFEHMMFQESQHVPQDQFFKKIYDAGGTLNGGTWIDGTIYFEVVPKSALEMVLWLESDRMGFLLPTVTQEAFKNQQEVVINEKRQRYDNQPYGQTNYVISKLMYPDGHPYNWQTIGSMEDLTNASLEDVHNFYKKWYVPNNATLVIAGDFDSAEVKNLVEKYFGEIKPGEKIEPPKNWDVELKESKKAFYQDKFATSPELNLVYPTAPQYTKDSYALEILSELLLEGKKAPLYKVIVEEKKLAPSVSGGTNSGEITGDFSFTVRAFPDKNLTDVENAIFEAFARFEKEKFTDKDLERIKAKVETNFYNGISSVLGKSFQLAMYNVFMGSPSYITDDLNNLLAVTKEDVWNVYNKYIKGKNYVMTSFVPAGKSELAAENSEEYFIEEENIEAPAAVAGSGEEIKVDEIASKFDRNIEPQKGPDPELSIPQVWEDKLPNGIRVLGIEQKELPLVQFSITLKGGLLLDDLNKVGVANLITDVMMEGTKNKTPIELEEAIDELGANIRMSTSRESIVLEANCLASKVDEVYKLAEEMLLEPRWDEKEFERIKEETIEKINRNKTKPATIASQVFNKLVYGDNHIFSKNVMGDENSVAAITIEDLKNYYTANFSPSVTYISVVGDISKNDAVKLFEPLSEKWESKEVVFPEYPQPEMPEKAEVYFVDFPDAKQSEIRIGHIGIPKTDPDFFAATVMNYKLGATFNGIVNLILREEKGYTYGARTYITGTNYPGTFLATSAVQTNATLESVEIFKEEIEKYREAVDEKDFEFTKNALIKSNARKFETLNALLDMVNDIARYDLDKDYVKQEEDIIKNMTMDDHVALAQKYLHPDRAYYLVVGDAATQMNQLSKLGFGKPILLDQEGNPVNQNTISMK